MTRVIDLNSDVGERFGPWPMGDDYRVLRSVSSANVACGVHAGDAATMRETVRLAALHDVALGAHPGLPDLQGFGRRAMALSPTEVADLVTYQIGALAAFATVAGRRLAHVKAHGALYNMAARDPAIALAIAGAVYALDPTLLLFGLAGSPMLDAAESVGLRGIGEAFPDRHYLADGTLVPRTHPDALVHDVEEAVARGVRMATEGMVRTQDGSEIAIRVGTLCIHGDAPGAAELAARLREALEGAGVTVAAPGPATFEPPVFA